MGSYCPSDDDIRSVIALCPDVHPDVVRKDLKFTQNVEATVNRILDGNICLSPQKGDLQPFTTVQPSMSSLDPDDDLPYIPAAKKRRDRIPSSTVTTSEAPQTEPHNTGPSNCVNTGKYCLSSLADKCVVNAKKFDTVESNQCLVTEAKNPLLISSDDDDDSDAEPVLPTLSKRLQGLKSSKAPGSKANSKSNFLLSAKLKCSGILGSDSDSDDLVSLPETLPIPERISLNHSSPSSNSTTSLSQSSSVSNYKVSNVIHKPTSSLTSSVSTCEGSQETVSSVTTMESQNSVEDSSDVPVNKKKRRTPAEIQEQKRLAEQKKQERERERLLKKQQKDLEKAEKKAAVDARRCMKPGECLKYIVVKFDSYILQSTVGPVLLKVLQEASVQYEIVNQPVPASVTWTRKVVDHEVQGTTLQQLSRDVDEEHGILVVPVPDFVSMIFGTINAGSTDRVSLPEFACQASANLADKKLSIIVQGMEKYFRDVKTLGQRQYKEAVRSTDPSYNNNKKQKGMDISIIVSKFDMEQALLELQLSPAGCNVSLVETPEEVAKTVLRLTKAVAEAPFKRERNQGVFSFLPDNKGIVKIDKDGGGLLKLWRQQLCQFHNLSPEMANAIVAEYPSPRLLLQAYEKCQTKTAAERLLEDIRVRRGVGVLETSRRVGKEMSRRIYELFNERDPDHVIQ